MWFVNEWLRDVTQNQNPDFLQRKSHLIIKWKMSPILRVMEDLIGIHLSILNMLNLLCLEIISIGMEAIHL